MKIIQFKGRDVRKPRGTRNERKKQRKSESLHPQPHPHCQMEKIHKKIMWTRKEIRTVGLLDNLEDKNTFYGSMTVLNLMSRSHGGGTEWTLVTCSLPFP